MTRAFRTAVALLALAGLSGCEAISNFGEATEPRDAYELRAPEITRAGPANLGNVLVELPSSTGALDTERIAVKPDALLVQYLPGVRWVDRATQHVQLLLVRTLSRTGRFGFVSGDTSGPTPDYVLLTDLTAFQAEIVDADGRNGTRVVVRADLTLLTDVDRRVVASRSFSSVAPAASNALTDIISAFDQATAAMLGEAAQWAVTALR